MFNKFGRDSVLIMYIIILYYIVICLLIMFGMAFRLLAEDYLWNLLNGRTETKEKTL